MSAVNFGSLVRFLSRRRWTVSLVTAIVFAVFISAPDRTLAQLSAATPTYRVDLSRIGYEGLSRTARLNDDANLSLDFIDSDHLLFTFNQKRLFKRLADCPRSHDDAVVRAIVMEITSGKVVNEAVWYLHDHRRYLWPVGSGRFLLRKGNSLYVLDSSLHEELLLNSRKPLGWVTVTPDKKQIVVESLLSDQVTGEDARSTIDFGEQRKSKHPYRFEFLDTSTLAPQRTVNLKSEVNLTGTSEGYADCVHKGHLWMIRFGPSADERKNITRVKSQTPPQVYYANDNSILVGRNPYLTKDYYSLTAFTVNGQRLWSKHLDRHRYFPSVATSADQRRVSISTLIAMARPPTIIDYEKVTDLQAFVEPDSFEQAAYVFDVASGKSILSLPVSPAVATGRNVTISMDGSRLAAFQGSFIEVYDLPTSAAEEAIQMAKVENETPTDRPASDAEAQVVPASFTDMDGQATGDIQIDADILQPPKPTASNAGKQNLTDGAIYSTEDSLIQYQPAAAQQHKIPPSRPLHFTVRVVSTGRREVGKREARKLLASRAKGLDLPESVELEHYGIDYEIESSDLRFRTQEDGSHHGELNFTVAAYANDGTKLGGKSEGWTTQLTAEEFKKALNDGIHIHQDVNVSFGAAVLRVGLQDKMSNHAATIEVPLSTFSPPQPQQPTPSTLPAIEPD